MDVSEDLLLSLILRVRKRVMFLSVSSSDDPCDSNLRRGSASARRGGCRSSYD